VFDPEGKVRHFRARGSAMKMLNNAATAARRGEKKQSRRNQRLKRSEESFSFLFFFAKIRRGEAMMDN